MRHDIWVPNVQLPDLLPLFPLPDHVLLLGLPTPYRVFEPRYRALVDGLLERVPSQRWLAVPRLADGRQHDGSAAPAIHEVVAAALARNIRPLDDGQFLIIVEGMARCRLIEQASPHPYRLARPEELPDLPAPDAGVEQAVAGVLLQVNDLRRRLGDKGSIIDPLLANQQDVTALIDRLAAALVSDPATRQRFLELRQLDQRIGLLHTTLTTLLGPGPGGRRGWEPSAN